MSGIIITGQTNPTCPLCLKQFEKVKTEHDNFFMCKRCQIGINVKDPLLGKWNDLKTLQTISDEGLDCMKCGSEMRFFFTCSGYMKAQCPTCKTTIETTREL